MAYQPVVVRDSRHASVNAQLREVRARGRAKQ
jgi:hypothetical protein